VARASLGILLGAERAIEVAGQLEPPPAVALDPAAAARLEADALRLRGDVAAAQMERRVLERELGLLRRERSVSPTSRCPPSSSATASRSRSSAPA
jgi:hypothetical protein